VHTVNHLARWTLPLLVGACSLAAAAEEKGYAKLFNGRNMDEFTLVGVTPATYKVQDGVIVCSGQPNGYFATKKSYRNYLLKFDWRYARPAGLAKDSDFGGNSGLLLHITGEHKVWPKCVEAQLMNKDAGNILMLGATGTPKKDGEAQAKAIKPVGEWNHQEVVCQDGKMTVSINGAQIATAEGIDLKEGPIGFQSEGAEIHFRDLQIKPLP
jgi:hypothetical protein